MKIKEWFQMMTLGQPYKYLRLMLWCLFDSIVMSIPYGLMLGAVYYLLAPLAQPGTALPTTALWLLVGGFLAQLIAYFFIRQHGNHILYHRSLFRLCRHHQGLSDHPGRTPAAALHGLLLRP